VRWIWDPEKDRINKARHRLGFELAQRVFDDPHAVSRPEPDPDEERWQTIGMIGPVVILVVHTWPDREAGDEMGRIISARKATPHERRAYEEGQF